MDISEVTVNDLYIFSPNLAPFAKGMFQAVDVFGINTIQRLCYFLAQCAYESNNFTAVVENLDYSANRLIQVWPSRFNVQNAGDYAHNPEKLANLVYANRLGNGDENSGDGWKYIGRGLLQITGKTNYIAISTALDRSGVSGIPTGELLENPDLLASPYLAALSAAIFFQPLLTYADAGDFEYITKYISGSLMSFSGRQAYLNKAIGIFT